ncbi:hypothetical protein [Oryza sativa Japonica Group]|uniref:Uncharacterized protein n=1 Tax=Oryza sativa subsp. japonica TaxID=39947 RepID=Q5VQR8_ORYSJ|nr:hypothetical protein [Oryza sativa Japonica Group]
MLLGDQKSSTATGITAPQHKKTKVIQESTSRPPRACRRAASRHPSQKSSLPPDPTPASPPQLGKTTPKKLQEHHQLPSGRHGEANPREGEGLEGSKEASRLEGNLCFETRLLERRFL